MEPIQLLTPEGELRDDADISLKITPELCRGFYREMHLGRRLDAEAFALQRQGELGLWCMSLGQEAAQVGSITAIDGNDYVFPSYREQVAALCRGITPGELLAQWRGVVLSGWNPTAYRFHVYTLVLGAQLLHATGYAMGVQRDGAAEIVLVYFGDGAASQGDANEAFNWAATVGAPVLFFCQNNQWAISTPVDRQRAAPLHQRARGFGMESRLVDGNDVLAVHAVTKAAADAVRDGTGPQLIEAVTYRMGGHSTSDDPTRYRSDSELELWRARDPIDRLHRFLDRQGWLDQEFVTAVAEESDALAAEARRACLAMADPTAADLFSRVFVNETADLAEESRRYLSYLGSFQDTDRDSQRPAATG